MKDRRAFIGSVAGGLLASPFAAFAQKPTTTPVIGILANAESPAWEGFRRGLRELGYVEGRNIKVEWRWADGKTERYADFAMELVQLKVDLIVSSNTSATVAAKKATGSIPILMLNSAYPEKIGLVQSLTHPGGNITGFSNVGVELMGKRLGLLKEIAPRVSRIALLWNPGNPVEPLGLQALQAGAAAVGLEIEPIDVRTPADHPAAFATIAAGRSDALHANGNPINFKNAQLIADFALKNRLPSSYDDRLFVDAGGLMSYAPNSTDTFRRAATYVDKILKGAKPADLPIQHPTKFEFVINARTAQALGLTIPPSVLLRADEIIQ